jgi:ribosomal protein L11 methylase PrmA
MIIRFLIKIAISFISPDLLQRGIRALAAQKSQSTDPKSGLKFLGELDRSLYHLQGDLAGTYGEGVHVKHRLTGSYKFFTDRINSNNTVLDIGCGNGALAFSIAKTTNAKVVGIDINPKTIKKARSLHSH